MAAPRKIESAFIATDLDEEIVLVGVDSGEFLSLEGTARAIWCAIDGARDTSQIAALLSDRYDIGDHAIESEVSVFLGELRDAGLVDWAGK